MYSRKDNSMVLRDSVASGLARCWAVGLVNIQMAICQRQKRGPLDEELPEKMQTSLCNANAVKPFMVAIRPVLLRFERSVACHGCS